MSTDQDSDFLPRNLIGQWKNFDSKDVFWIRELDLINSDSIFFALNIGQNSKLFDTLAQSKILAFE